MGAANLSVMSANATAKANRGACFVIMPITVPPLLADKYADGAEHFRNVFRHLFEPAINRAGFKAIDPKAKGSDLIHAGIIKNLEIAELVLCDMSILNPNVFFEWGVRTALNKPVCVVRDDVTTDRPFDTAILNSYTYDSIPTWNVEQQIDALHQHIEETVAAGGGNAMWRTFGLQVSAAPVNERPGERDQLAFLTSQVEALRREVASSLSSDTTPEEVTLSGDRLELQIAMRLSAEKMDYRIEREGLNSLVVKTWQPVPDRMRRRLAQMAASAGFSLVFSQIIKS